MIRTQVQLTEQQALALRMLAGARKVSIAELIRQSIEAFLQTSQGIDLAEKKQRAISVAGKFRSDVSDLGTNHDRYLAEAYRE